jgi:hypothetical protein
MSLDNTFPELLLPTVAVVGSVALIMAVILVFLRTIKDSRYNEERHRVELSFLRDELEHKINELNFRLTENRKNFNDINHLLLSSQKFEPDPSKLPGKARLPQFLRSAGIREDDIEIDRRMIFVLTPFHEDEEKTFQVVKNACVAAGFDCLRGDESKVSGEILPEILKYIAKSRMIIANINGRNPNVFYELGIAHAMDKPVILLAKVQEDDLPFDLRTTRILFYQNLREFSRKLLPAIAQITSHETSAA